VSIAFRPLERATEEYDRDSEERFRRELESFLMHLSAESSNATSRDSPRAAMASTRMSFLVSPVSLYSLT
jgi:hypothetical protein